MKRSDKLKVYEIVLTGTVKPGMAKADIDALCTRADQVIIHFDTVHPETEADKPFQETLLADLTSVLKGYFESVYHPVDVDDIPDVDMSQFGFPKDEDPGNDDDKPKGKKK